MTFFHPTRLSSMRWSTAVGLLLLHAARLSAVIPVSAKTSFFMTFRSPSGRCLSQPITAESLSFTPKIHI